MKNLIVIFFSFLSYHAFSQIRVGISFVDSSHTLFDGFSNESFTTPAQAEKTTQKKLEQLIEQGYLTASMDSWKCDSANCYASLFIGKQYKWAHLDASLTDEYMLSKIGYRDRLYNQTPISGKQLTRLTNKILTYYENNGYPFAAVKLDSIQIQSSDIFAQLVVETNKYIVFDSIVVVGDAKISPAYLHNYIDIKPNSPYSELKINRISTRMKELPFINQSKDYEVVFSEEDTKLTLFLKNKKASRFDGVLGILPNENSNKVLFTGDVKLLLLNAIGKGESIDLNWRKLQNQTTDLKVNASYPFLLNTPFGIEGKFLLYKRDTTFQDVEGIAGIQYLLPRGNYFKVYGGQRQSRLLSTEGMENITALPNQIDVNNSILGIGLKSEKMDYRFNPTRGYQFIIEGGAGNRKIIENDKLPSKIYYDLKTSTYQLNSTLQASYFIPVFKQATIKIGMKGAYKYSEQLFRNELYRIGGLLTLRGFDEESINASSYAIGTAEFRYLLEQNSYTYIFFDGCYYENRSIEGFNSDTPFGFGAGISFETKAGIFSLNYALGYQQDQLAPLRSAKIHFGFVNFF